MKDNRFIECPRYGGRRSAPACINLDRYRSCRRSCKSLERYLKEVPDAVSDAKGRLAAAGEKLVQTTLFAGQRLPDSELRCACGFQAKSLRGLKTHVTRRHGKARR